MSTIYGEGYVADIEDEPDEKESDTLSDCTPNHMCKGRMIHLPSGEQCDKCGEEL